MAIGTEDFQERCWHAVGLQCAYQFLLWYVGYNQSLLNETTRNSEVMPENASTSEPRPSQVEIVDCLGNIQVRIRVKTSYKAITLVFQVTFYLDSVLKSYPSVSRLQAAAKFMMHLLIRQIRDMQSCGQLPAQLMGLSPIIITLHPVRVAHDTLAANLVKAIPRRSDET